MRGARCSSRVLRAKLLRAHAARTLFACIAFAALACAVLPEPALGIRGTRALDDALARAAGNRRPEAVRLGEALFAEVWPVQILKVRVDGVGGHMVAGLVLSGTKFHRRLDAAQFTQEVAAIVARAFAAAPIEEVDVWAILPLKVAPHTIVAGDYAAPTSRIVYSATIRRSEGTAYAARLRRGEDVFWDTAWKRTLGP